MSSSYTILIIILILIILCSISTYDEQKEYYTNPNPTYINDILKNDFLSNIQTNTVEKLKNTLRNTTELLKNGDNPNEHIYSLITNTNMLYNNSTPIISNNAIQARQYQHGIENQL